MFSILGMGHAHPQGKIDNKFLEDLQTGTSEQWILEKIGIITRRTTLPLDYIRDTRNSDPRLALEVASMTPTDLGVLACEMALEKAGVRASQIGMIMCNGCTPRTTSPSEVQGIARRLGLENIPAFEVFTACPVFALHIDFLRNYRADELPEFILGVSTATLTQKVNYNDRSDGAIWGDGAAAWVISTKEIGKLKVVDSYYMADPTRCHSVVVDTFGFFHQDGRAVRDFSVRQTVRLIKQIEEKHQIDWTRDIFIGHQANATMLSQITNNRDIPDTNHWQNVTNVGNQAGAGAPAVLSMHWDQIKPKQKILVAVVGAGLSWGSALFEA